MTEALTKQARRSHLHCFCAVLWLTMTVPATNVEGRDFRRGSAFSVDKKPKHSKILTTPSLCHLMFTACLTLNVLLTICGLSVKKKKKEKKKAEALRTILCRSIAPFLHVCVCVCISSLLKNLNDWVPVYTIRNMTQKMWNWIHPITLCLCFCHQNGLKWMKWTHTQIKREIEGETKCVS